MLSKSFDLTHGRSVEVTFDEFPDWSIGPPYVIDTDASQMGPSTASETNTLHRLDFGWQMRAKANKLGLIHESTEVQTGFFLGSNGKATLAPNHTETNTQRQQPLSGLSYGADVPLSGKKMIRKDVPTGASAEQRLTADQASYPGPAQTGEVTDLDRVMVTLEDHAPIDHLFITWSHPDHGAAAVDVLFQFFFSGPAGLNENFNGYGQYCARVYGDLTLKLYERGEDDDGVPSWRFRYWVNLRDGYGREAHVSHVLHVFTDAVQNPDGSYSGKTISFVSDSTRPGFGALAGTLARQIGTYSIQAKTAPKYVVPTPGRPTTTEKARVDVRRDLFLEWVMGKHVFPSSVELRDKVFTTDHWPFEDQIVQFEVDCVRPPGTTMTVQLYDASDDTALTQETILDDRYGLVVQAKLHARKRAYYPVFTFGSDGRYTPTLQRSRVIVKPSTEQVVATTKSLPDWQDVGTVVTLVTGACTNFRLCGPTADPSSTVMTFLAHDLGGGFSDVLYGRDMVPVKVTTTYDPADTSKKSVLFQGYTQCDDAEKIGSGYVYPVPESHRVQVNCVGSWRRFQDSLAPKNFFWYDNTAGKGWKITDMAFTLLQLAGVPENRIDVPDLPMRTFLDGSMPMLEQSAPVLPALTRVLKDYLGAYVVEDLNASLDGGTTVGIWRVLQQKRGKPDKLADWGGLYRPMVRFCEGDKLGDSVTGGAAVVYAPTLDSALGTDTVDGFEVPIVWTAKGSLRRRPFRPEGNIVVVRNANTGDDSGKLGQSQAAQISQVVYNVKSCNFFALPSSHPNYPTTVNADGSKNPEFLGFPAPIHVYDSTLTTEAAVNFVARRVYEFACVSRQEIEFDGPLVLVWDQDDDKQVNPRPLRFYDTVQVWNSETSAYEDWLVKSCDPKWDKDHVMLAHYLLVRPSNLDTVASLVPFGSMNPFASWLKKTVFGLGRDVRVDIPQGKRMTDTGLWASLPESPIAAIQELDPDNSDFGKFYWMMDYDPLGS